MDAHPAGDEIKALLEARGIKGAKFNIDGDVEHIDITTALGAAVSPLVVDSIWQPIAESYQAAGLANEWGHLVKEEAERSKDIPAPQQVQYL